MTTVRKSATLLSSVVLGFALSGCTGLGGLTQQLSTLKEPKVSLAGLSLKDISLTEPSFLVKLKVENPNDLNVNLDGADVSLALNGQPVATGISRSPLTLVKRGASTMDVEVKANTLGVLQQIMQLESKGGVQYGVSGHLNLLNWLGALGKVPFNFQGSVDKATLLKGAEGLGGLGKLLLR